jgi:hypothetical protein
MILLLLGLAFLFISTFFVYKTAKENGYNALLWAAASFSAFIGVYMVLSVTIVVIVALGIAYLGWARSTLESGGMVIDLLVMAASAGSVMLILRHVNQIKDEEPFIEELPPPPHFGDKI